MNEIKISDKIHKNKNIQLKIPKEILVLILNKRNNGKNKNNLYTNKHTKKRNNSKYK